MKVGDIYKFTEKANLRDVGHEMHYFKPGDRTTITCVRDATVLLNGNIWWWATVLLNVAVLDETSRVEQILKCYD